MFHRFCQSNHFPNPLRLSQKLAALKFEEAQINIEKDIEQISSWSQRFDLHSARQAVPLCVCVVCDVTYLDMCVHGDLT